MTNKFGDMIKEMRDPATPQARVDEISRLFNELSDREEIYKSWLQKTSKDPKFESMTVRKIFPLESPLSLHVFHRFTDATIPNNTNTYVTFEQDPNVAFDYGSNDAFFSDPSDLSVIRVRGIGQSLQVSGRAIWEQNATGYRALYIEYDGSSPFALYTAAGQNLVDNVHPVSYADTFYGFQSPIQYIRFYVFQSSGGDLALKDLFLGLHIA